MQRIKGLIVAFAALVLASIGASADTEHSGAGALRTLLAGNRRYVTQRMKHPHQNQARLREVSKAQHPTAAVLSCADSRVPPEIVFDSGLGDIFTVRVAGNVIDDDVEGSLEYAVEHLHVSVIIVLGHSGCGAVKAAVAGGETHTHIDSLIHAIQPAVEEAKKEQGDLVENSVRANVRRSVEALKADASILAEKVKAGSLKIVGGIYDLKTGRVRLLK
jgi:carbonic anhydrase